MLKSTAPPRGPPLPPGWTEHKAPTGHIYYYNSSTQTSTYKRPSIEESTNTTSRASLHNLQPLYSPNFVQPQLQVQPQPIHYAPQHSRRPEHWQNAKDRPRTKHDIPGCAPWLLVKTKLGRRFVHNPDTGESFWRFPKDVIGGVVEFDIQERKQKEEEENKTAKASFGSESNVTTSAAVPSQEEIEQEEEGEGDAEEEYDEIEIEEVSASEDEDDDDANSNAKRRRLENDEDESRAETQAEENVEFGEDDMAWQLAQMEELEGYPEDEYYPEEEREDEDAGEGNSMQAFQSLLNDAKISPYTSWDSIVAEGNLVDDERYTMLPNMKSRREAFSIWSSARISEAKRARETSKSRDPRVAYLALLHEHAAPKLFWPEFKRKYKKENAMKDSKLTDKEREKIYRDLINRLTKRTEEQRKRDLMDLLLECASDEASGAYEELQEERSVPEKVMIDVRYISLPTRARNKVIDEFLAAKPSRLNKDGMAKSKDREAEVSLQVQRKRDKEIDERQRRQEQELRYAKARLHASEAELERATKNIGKEALIKSLQ